MNAVISGRAGLALVIEGESLMSLDVDDLGTLVPRSPYDLRFLLADATDLVTLENTGREEIAQRLDLEHDIACALDMTLIALDPGSSMELRAEAVAALDELLADARVIERLEFTMYAKPLPDSADLMGALFCTEVKTAAARSFFERLSRYQTSISAVGEAWDALPDHLFGNEPTAKAVFHDVACHGGLFRLLALSYGDQAKMSAFLLEALKNRSITSLRNHREVVQRWCAPIRDAVRAVAPALEAGRFDEAALLPKGTDNRISLGDWASHITNVTRAKMAVIPPVTRAKMAVIPPRFYRIAITVFMLFAAFVVYQVPRHTPPDTRPFLIPVQASIKLSRLKQLNHIRALDYQETSDSVIVSLNAPSGLPNNFVRVSRTGVITQFSNAAGFRERVYLAVAPSQSGSGKGLSLGGFTAGDVFAGSGTGKVARISADGTTVQNVFATLPGETGQEWGGLSFDRTGNFGGDLLVATITGGVYRVNSAGVATLVARKQANGAIEGIIALPNDARFGPLAGRILVGGTDIGIPMTGATNIFVVDPIDAMHPAGTFTGLNVPGEGFRIVPPGGDFFVADLATQTVLTAPARQFSDIVGDLIIASIDPNTKTSKLFDVVWDPVNAKLRTTEIVGGSVAKYKDIAFSIAMP